MFAQCRWFARVDSSGGSQFEVLHSSGCRKDVSRIEAALLVEEDEETHSRVCGSLSKLPAGEVQASTSGWITSEVRDSGVEMGAEHYGFRCWTPTDSAEV